tara:strand:+ start:16 stop:468 length:453 start_codon:yes stop_codon:yes gene_type:complete
LPRSYVRKAGLDQTDCVIEARLIARLSVQECIELCDISERTWYRWLKNGAPTWALRLILSQEPSLDRFGWKDWEISGGCLYFKQLSYRYYWTPAKLILPLWGITDSSAPWSETTDNLSAIEPARKARQNSRNVTKTPINAASKPHIHSPA